MIDTVEKCENCSGNIGKLETPQIWNGSVVCWDCHKKLTAQHDEKESAERAVAQADYEKKARQEMREEMAQIGGSALAEAAIPSAIPNDLRYAKAQLRIPSYTFLNIISSAYMVLGYLAITIGIILMLVIIGGSVASGNAGAAAIGTGIGVASGLYCLLIGIILCGFGQLLRCIRDMARNSWIIAQK